MGTGLLIGFLTGFAVGVLGMAFKVWQICRRHDRDYGYLFDSYSRIKRKAEGDDEAV